MNERDPNHRGGGERGYQWIRSNILGLVAIFIALSGSAIAAQVASHPAAKAATKKAKPGPPGPAAPQGSQGPPEPSTGPAGGDLAGSYPNAAIAPNAVGPGEIQDPLRAVNLPLTSFVDTTASKLLDLDPANSDGTSPD